MAPCEVSSSVSATPETIWETCFVPMKWEEWDPDLNEVKDASGGCEDGMTCVFAMKDGNDIPITLKDVVPNKSLTFSGGMLGGAIGATGIVLITPVDATTSKIDYSFELSGCLGGIFGKLNAKAIVEGTEGGLANMVKLSEEAQKAK
eukprot:CAMPEP_0197283926 /NCGR_PEP_ID=MMETSP1432-20130617/25180_1 /TAXON_ID=44447 /ORGANISM="Pseudo-nitzschia delicatissima, Strain UNC1205" /LENGTH=146 /DNA_ID=CAMNT_0042750925 /DNA_START=50 /DNA_END=490 /DNA_ORIENTATION=+